MNALSKLKNVIRSLNKPLEWLDKAPVIAQLFVLDFLILLALPEWVYPDLGLWRGFSLHGAFAWFSSMHMHGNFLHLLGNFTFMAPFAWYLERKLGAKRFIVLYHVYGFGSGLLWMFSGFYEGPGWAIGSSGAACGVVMAALLLAMQESVYLRVFAGLLAISLFSQQLLMSFISMVVPLGIAFVAHLGGICMALFAPHFWPALYKKTRK